MIEGDSMSTSNQLAEKAHIDPHANCWHENGIVRLSDPCMKEAYDRMVQDITKDRDSAMRFLRKIGVCTPEGKLAERYGGDPGNANEV